MTAGGSQPDTRAGRMKHRVETDENHAALDAEIQLVIFDCDGVLVDSEIISATVLVAELSREGIALDVEQATERFLGRSFPAIAASLYRDFSIRLPDEFEDRYRTCLLTAFDGQLQPTPGIDRLLSELSVAKCVATSSSVPRASRALAVTGLDRYFANALFTESEVRQGKAAKRWFQAYYGTLDATPLYLVLLSEVWRWTDDAAFVQRLKGPALAALEWIDRYGDRDGDGFVEYEKRSERGLDNQSWKDSGDSQRFADGRVAAPPIAPCEVQGYVYDAKRRLAEIARAVWRDRVLGDRLEAEAAALKSAFNEAYWVEERGGYYALALDQDKQRVDSMCSNMGHLLWSGIVPPTRVDAVADALMGDALWSGWGVRTMSTGDRAYNPLSYHNGTVWPHDNSLIAAGLARYERWPEAFRIVQRMLEAAAFFGHELPEVFAGLPRTQTPFPIAYPTAARPQAWAAGTPVLLLQVLLGLQPDRQRQTLETLAPPELPSWAGSLRLSSVRVFDRSWDVQVEDGRVRVEES